LLFAWLTNLVGFCIGFLVLFVSVGVTLALAWDGSMDKLPYIRHRSRRLVGARPVIPANCTHARQAADVGFAKDAIR
jgi:hypothetical protein